MAQKHILLLFILLVQFCFGQNKKIDSIKQDLEKTTGNEKRLNLLDDLNKLLISGSSLNNSEPYFTEMAAISNNLKNRELESKAYNYLSEVSLKKWIL